jgi:hypothetical protein
MATQPRPVPKFDLDPGAFNAALFEAYKGGCDCAACKILRKAVESIVKEYLPEK